MEFIEKNSKLDILLSRISTISYIIVIIFGLLGYFFIYMDSTFLFTAILAGLGLIKNIRDSVIKTFILFSIVIIGNILRTVFTFPDKYHSSGSFLPYYELINYLWSVIILTYLGIIMVILYYRKKEKYSLFNVSCAFGQLAFLKFLTMFLLLYLAPSGNGSPEIINQIHLMQLIAISISSIGIIFLLMAKKISFFIFSGIILGVGILVLNLWFLILILPKYEYLIPPTEGKDFSRLLDYSLFSTYISIFWMLIMISLLIYNVVVNRNDLIQRNKFDQQAIE